MSQRNCASMSTVSLPGKLSIIMSAFGASKEPDLVFKSALLKGCQVFHLSAFEKRLLVTQRRQSQPWDACLPYLAHPFRTTPVLHTLARLCAGLEAKLLCLYALRMDVHSQVSCKAGMF